MAHAQTFRVSLHSQGSLSDPANCRVCRLCRSATDTRLSLLGACLLINRNAHRASSAVGAAPASAASPGSRRRAPEPPQPSSQHHPSAAPHAAAGPSAPAASASPSAPLQRFRPAPSARQHSPSAPTPTPPAAHLPSGSGSQPGPDFDQLSALIPAFSLDDILSGKAVPLDLTSPSRGEWDGEGASPDGQAGSAAAGADAVAERQMLSSGLKRRALRPWEKAVSSLPPPPPPVAAVGPPATAAPAAPSTAPRRDGPLAGPAPPGRTTAPRASATPDGWRGREAASLSPSPASIAISAAAGESVLVPLSSSPGPRRSGDDLGERGAEVCADGHAPPAAPAAAQLTSTAASTSSTLSGAAANPLAHVAAAVAAGPRASSSRAAARAPSSLGPSPGLLPKPVTRQPTGRPAARSNQSFPPTQQPPPPSPQPSHEEPGATGLGALGWESDAQPSAAADARRRAGEEAVRSLAAVPVEPAAAGGTSPIGVGLLQFAGPAPLVRAERAAAVAAAATAAEEGAAAAAAAASEAVPQAGLGVVRSTRAPRAVRVRSKEWVTAAQAVEIATAATTTTTTTEQQQQPGTGAWGERGAPSEARRRWEGDWQGGAAGMAGQSLPEAVSEPRGILVLHEAPLRSAMEAAAAPETGAAGPLPSREELHAEEVDRHNWRTHAAVLFPDLYDADWHGCLFDFLFELWPEVGRAHVTTAAASGGGGGASRRLLLTSDAEMVAALAAETGGAAAAAAAAPPPPPPARVARASALIDDAFAFAARCFASRDFAVRSALVVSALDCLDDHDALMGAMAARLPPLAVQRLLVPMASHFQPPWVVEEWLGAVREAYPGHAPVDTVPRRWRELLGRLQAAQAVHPGGGLGVVHAVLEFEEPQQEQQQEPDEQAKAGRQHLGEPLAMAAEAAEAEAAGDVQPKALACQPSRQWRKQQQPGPRTVRPSKKEAPAMPSGSAWADGAWDEGPAAMEPSSSAAREVEAAASGGGPVRRRRRGSGAKLPDGADVAVAGPVSPPEGGVAEPPPRRRGQRPAAAGDRGAT